MRTVLAYVCLVTEINKSGNCALLTKAKRTAYLNIMRALKTTQDQEGGMGVKLRCLTLKALNLYG